MVSDSFTIPEKITTPRLVLKRFMPGDGQKINEAIVESFVQLTQWMDWATQKPTVQESEDYCCMAYEKWNVREELAMIIWDKDEQTILGASGFHSIDWSIPKLETGYWIRTSMTNKGIASETLNALTQFAFEQLKVNRIALRCDEDNLASRKVAEKSGFVQEALLHNDRLKMHSRKLGNTLIYARIDSKNLPTLKVGW